MRNFGNRAIFGGFTRFGVWRNQKTQSMTNFGNRANLRHSVFGRFTRFGGLENPKNTKLAWYPRVR